MRLFPLASGRVSRPSTPNRCDAQNLVPRRRSSALLACALMPLALAWIVLPNNAEASRPVRQDAPGQACNIAYWTNFTGDLPLFLPLDGGGATAFEPGSNMAGATLMYCGPYYNGQYLSPGQLWTMPAVDNPTTNIEANTEAANAASDPFPNSGADSAQFGLPQNLSEAATAAFMYIWAVPSGLAPPNAYNNPAAALTVWTLPNGDYEFEFDGWCGTSSATAMFTWQGNIYTAICSSFTGADLIIDSQSGLPDGYVPYPNYSSGITSGLVDWSVSYATSIVPGSAAGPIVSTAPIAITVQVLKTDLSGIGIGTVQLLDTNGVTSLGSQPVNSSGYATFSVPARAAGTYTFTAKYTGVSGLSQNSTVAVPVTVAPPAPTLTLTPTSVVLGQSAMLSWTSSGANSCAASGAWSGSEALSGSVSVTPTTLASQTYFLVCTGNGIVSATGNAVLAVTAPPAPTVTVSVAPAAITLGQSATLTWSSTNATACTADSAWTGSRATSGTLSVTPGAAGGFAYSLTCTGVGGVGNGAAALVVNAAAAPPGNSPAVTVTISPSTIALGQTATVTWTSTNATSCVADSAWSGSEATSGSLPITPTTTGGFAYSLTCTGSGGTGNGAAALIVNTPTPAPGAAPTVTINVAPGTITLGQSATVTWSSTNATSCTAESAWSGSQMPSGTLSVTPTATGGLAYSLTCSGSGGTTNAAAALSVGAAPTAAASTTPAASSGKSGGGGMNWPELLVLGGACWAVVRGRRRAQWLHS
jgi:hypothetical protein